MLLTSAVLSVTGERTKEKAAPGVFLGGVFLSGLDLDALEVKNELNFLLLFSSCIWCVCMRQRERERESLALCPGWSVVVRSQLTAALPSQVQVILPSWPPE